jgi:prepilin-type processing-associated H-X9-DG protein
MEETQTYERVMECIAQPAIRYASVSCTTYKDGVGIRTPTLLICPSAPTVDPEYNLAAGTSVPTNLAKGNYAACFGAWSWINADNVPPDLSTMTSELPEEQRTGPPNKGIFEVVNIGDVTGKAMLASKQGTRMMAVRDGSTKTMLLSEILAWKSPIDGRGAWFWNGMGGSSFTAFLPPNSEQYDVVRLCGAETTDDEPRYMCSSSAGSNEPANYAAARSAHIGTVNTVFADGHTQTISDSIDRRVWKSYATRNGPDFWNESQTPPFAVWVEPDAQPGLE